MKRISIVLFLLVTLSPLFAQRTASNWGERILFGTTFTSTDSTKLVLGALRDTVLADTLYSGVLYINDWSDGIWSVDCWFDSLGGGADSMRLDYRRVTTIRDKNARANFIKYGIWKKLLHPMKYDTLYTLPVAQSDSVWWHAGNGRQFRLYSTATTTDTALHKITDFLR